MRKLLQEVPGLGRVGADIFLREAQGLWAELDPWVDAQTAKGAERPGLPGEPQKLAKVVAKEQLAAFAAALVRAALDTSVVLDVSERTEY